MAAPQAAECGASTRQRAFFCVLKADQRTFLLPKFNEGERLSVRMLSLGLGARDEMHVLEAEGAYGLPVRLSQTDTKLYVQPCLPVLRLTGITLTLPVTFKLTVGPGPLYVSGRLLVGDEEDDDDDGHGAPVVATPKKVTQPQVIVPVMKAPIPQVLVPPAKAPVPLGMAPAVKAPRPHVLVPPAKAPVPQVMAPVTKAPVPHIVVPVTKVAVPHVKLPLTKILVPHLMQAEKKVPVPLAVVSAKEVPVPHTMQVLDGSRYHIAKADQDLKIHQPSQRQIVSTLPIEDNVKSSVSNDAKRAMRLDLKKAPSPFKAFVPTVKDEQVVRSRRQRHRNWRFTPLREAPSVEEVKTRILVSIQNGVILSKSLPRFQNFLSNCYGVMDPKCIEELWQWKQTLE